MNLVEKARIFATKAHAGQTRKHGNRPYIYHPSRVATYLEERAYTDCIISSAWLHDVLEDTDTSYNTLEEEFGSHIARLVWEVSHPPAKGNRANRWEIYLQHYINASVEGKILKLADRYSNLQEYVDFWDEVPHKDRKFLQEVYLDGSIDLLDNLFGVDEYISRDLIYIINQLDELCSEEI